MLHSVPTAVNRASRQVTLRHPNSFDAVVSRKVVKRVENDQNGDPNEMGGAPTLGGMGVLRSEDEPEFEYEPLGAAKVARAAAFPQSDFIDRGNGVLAEGAMEVLIECVAKEGTPEFFVVENDDLVSIIVGPGVVISYTAATTASPVGLAPYERRYVLNPRDDLAYIEPFED
jgi:hypothetical protein